MGSNKFSGLEFKEVNTIRKSLIFYTEHRPYPKWEEDCVIDLLKQSEEQVDILLDIDLLTREYKDRHVIRIKTKFVKWMLNFHQKCADYFRVKLGIIDYEDYERNKRKYTKIKLK